MPLFNRKTSAYKEDFISFLYSVQQYCYIPSGMIRLVLFGSVKSEEQRVFELVPVNVVQHNVVIERLRGKRLVQTQKQSFADFFKVGVGLKACIFVKKRLQHKYFPVNIAKFLRAAFFYRTPLVAAFANMRLEVTGVGVKLQRNLRHQSL